MKLLCPIDFSDSSINAAKWAGNYLMDKGGDHEVLFFHCINQVRRANMFVSMNDIMREKAENDFELLLAEIRAKFPEVKFSSYISLSDPKDIIPEYAEKHDFDLIIIGTRGLSTIKELTVGSVANHLFNNSKVPVMAIPVNSEFQGIKSVVLGMDSDNLLSKQTLEPLIGLVQRTGAKIYMTHIQEIDDPIIEYDPSYDLFLEGIDRGFVRLNKDKNIADTLTEFNQEINSDVLCMISHKRTWLQRLFNRSALKEELFILNTPLLVLPEVVPS